LYLTPTNSHWACDIEANGLLDTVSKVWCVCLLNVITKEEVQCLTEAEFKAFQEKHPDAIFVGHNFLSYDAPVLNRLWNARIVSTRIVDTFVLSQVYNPSYPSPAGLNPKGTPKEERKGPHSLKAWGLRLRYPKSSHEDFDHYSPEMLRYCRRDTRLTGLLFIRLSERMRSVGFTDRGVELEHLAWNIIQNKQRRNGFPFDLKRAQELYVTLRAREEELASEVFKLWPPQFVVVKHYKQRRLKNGADTVVYKRAKEQYPELRDTIDGGFDAYDWVAFNLGSPDQRVEKLLELGWTPSQRTKAGNPKVDEDELLNFAEVSGTRELVALAKWIVINSRANMIRTWMNAYDERTGAIHGKLLIANTLRYRHSSPNSANIPAVRLKKDDDGVERIQYGEGGAYTYECRDLWTCGDANNWSLVGIDGTGIQNRCLIHHLIKTVGEETVAEFKALALSGDVHKRNIEVLGLANKAAAKKFYYTLMMGGRGARLAADQAQFGTKMTPRQGDILRKKMIEGMPGFGELIKNLEAELERTGRVRLCDGTPVLVNSPHKVIPTILQGDESRLMKQALIYLDQEIRKARLAKFVFKVADIHDEWQWRVHNDAVDDFIRLALPCFPRAGESFGYKIPIDGDAKRGLTWAETH
jgi:DNA polymerase-1